MAFGPTLTLLNKDGKLAGALGGTLSQWLVGRRIVLSRALCSHERIKNDEDLSKTHQLKRAYLHALEKSPFAQPGVFLKSERDSTTIWSWDSERITKDAGASDILCVPESAFYGKLDDGFYVIRCIDGYEGLCCKDGDILLSRWWPDLPAESDWLRFTLNAEQHGVPFAPRPEPIELSKARRKSAPRNELSPRELLRMSDIGRLVMIALVVLALATLYPVGRWVHLTAQSNLLGSQINELTSQFDEQLDVMRRQSELNQSINNIAGAVQAPSIFLPFSEGVYIVSIAGGTVNRVNYAANQWEIGFAAPADFNETELVRLLEQNDQLSSASVEADRRANNWIARFQQSPAREE